MDALTRFYTHVDRGTESGCHIWTGGTMGQGYGSFGVGSRTDGSRRTVSAHRFIWESHYGPIAEGLTIDHLCRNRRCVNPYHLDIVSNRENVLRGQHPNVLAHHADTCKHGHSLLDAHIKPDGTRKCRVCSRLRQAAKKAHLRNLWSL